MLKNFIDVYIGCATFTVSTKDEWNINFVKSKEK